MSSSVDTLLYGIDVGWNAGAFFYCLAVLRHSLDGIVAIQVIIFANLRWINHYTI